MINGLILVDKPEGITSTHVINKLKRILKIKKMGHAGTLDPFATGLLPIAVGEATKVLPYIFDADKEYVAEVQLGCSTNTFDRDGNIVNSSNCKVTLDKITKEIQSFIGNIKQIPPAFSAIKINGQRAYNLARDNIEFEIKPRQVSVYDIQVLYFDFEKQLLKLKINCSKGTYIRSIANDLGEVLGCYAHLSTLRRTRIGKFSLDRSFLLEILEKMVHNDDCNFLLSIGEALDDIPVLLVDELEVEKIRFGQKINSRYNFDHNTKVLAVFNQTPIAIMLSDNFFLKPIRLFNL